MGKFPNGGLRVIDWNEAPLSDFDHSHRLETGGQDRGVLQTEATGHSPAALPRVFTHFHTNKRVFRFLSFQVEHAKTPTKPHFVGFFIR
jgi:hypothetical protein